MLCNRLTIRKTRPADNNAIADIQRQAFGREAEARLALMLIEAPDRTFSFLAECDGKPVGHLLLSEIGAPVRALALAPLAVLAPWREMQVGTALVREAIAHAGRVGYEAMFVLGDNAYYERFGFSSPAADPFEIGWQGTQFMALELNPGALEGKSGKLAYPEAFFEL